MEDRNLIINDDINFNDPAIFTEKINTLKEQLPAILSDFKKSYIQLNTYPANTPPRKLINHSGELNPMIATDEFISSPSLMTRIGIFLVSAQVIDN